MSSMRDTGDALRTAAQPGFPIDLGSVTPCARSPGTSHDRAAHRTGAGSSPAQANQPAQPVKLSKMACKRAL
jgi:hypothetical protein